MSALCQKRTFCSAVKNVVIRSLRRRATGRTPSRRLLAGRYAHRLGTTAMQNEKPSLWAHQPTPISDHVAFNDRLTDRETHSHPACFGREHWFKNATEIGYTNSTPGIRD